MHRTDRFAASLVLFFLQTVPGFGQAGVGPAGVGPAGGGPAGVEHRGGWLLELESGRAFLDREGEKTRKIEEGETLRLGDRITTSPKVRATVTDPEGRTAALQGLGRYEKTPDGLVRRVGADGLQPVVFGGRAYIPPAAPDPVAPLSSTGPLAQVHLLAGSGRTRATGWPDFSPIAGLATLYTSGLVHIDREGLAEISTLDGGWIKVVGPANLKVDRDLLILEKGEFLIRNLGGRRVQIGPYQVDPGDYLLGFKKGKTIRIRSFEGIVPVRGDAESGSSPRRKLFLPPGREVVFDTIHAVGKTQNLDIPGTLKAWNRVFDAAKTRRIAEERLEDVPTPDPGPEPGPLVPEIEPRRHHRLSLRERMKAQDRFTNAWYLVRKREYERTRRHVALQAEARRRDPDNEVKALEEFKARSRLTFAHRTLTELSLGHSFRRELTDFLVEPERDRRRLEARETLFGQPFRLQSRRAILTATLIDTAIRARVDELTNQVLAQAQAGADPALIEDTRRLRNAALDGLGRRLDATENTVRTGLEPDLYVDP